MRRLFLNIKNILRRCKISRSKKHDNSAPIPLDRSTIAKMFLKGDGIEIGALHDPIEVPDNVRVKYVDRFPEKKLREHYPELNEKKIVDPEILDDGERLKTVADASQDFVIANGILEHFENPLRAIENMHRILKRDGILYLHVPDKNCTFDIHRPVTSLEHLLADYKETPLRSRKDEFEEWAKFVQKAPNDTEAKQFAEKLMKMNYSIHFHVWTQAEILEILIALTRQLNLNFTVELIFRFGYGFIIILRKR